MMNIAIKIIDRNSRDLTQKHEIELEEGQKFTIGRAQCDLNLTGDGISRKHLRLVVQKHSLVVEDLNSRNGTFHNNKKISSVAIHEAETVSVGTCILLFEKIGEKPPPRKSVEPGSDFIFLRDGKPAVPLIVPFYKTALSGWKTFFITTPFAGVPIERSLIVLAGIGAASGVLSALMAAVRSPAALMGIVPVVIFMTVMTTMAGLVFAGLHHLLRKFLGASGDFTQYLCLFTYTAALGLPVTVLSGLLGPLAGVLYLAYSAWALWGFSKAFHASLPRLCVLWGGITVVLAAGPLMLLLSLLKR